QSAVSRNQIRAVAVSGGPGSYTGLRIGVSTAKGLAYALEVPLIGVDTLDALAKRAVPFIAEADVVVLMIDARRMVVYCKVLSSALDEIVPLAPLVVAEAFIDAYLLKG